MVDSVNLKSHLSHDVCLFFNYPIQTAFSLVLDSSGCVNEQKSPCSCQESKSGFRSVAHHAERAGEVHKFCSYLVNGVSISDYVSSDDRMVMNNAFERM